MSGARVEQIANILQQKIAAGMPVEQAMKLYDQAVAQESASGGFGSGMMSAANNPFGPVQMGYANSGMGYGSAMNVTPSSAVPSSGYNDAMSAMMGYGASMNNSANQLAGTQYTADRSLQGQLGVSANQLAGSNYGWDAQKVIADMQTLRNLLGIKDTNATQLGISGNQLSGVKDTNLANQNIATTQGNAQMGTAAINVGPKYTQLDILSQLLGGNAGGLGTGLGVGGQTANVGGGGGTAVDLGGSNGTGTTGTAAPPIPAFRTFDDIALQKKMGGANADIAQNYDAQQKQMTNSLAGRGFSTHSPGFQSLIANSNAQKLGAMQDSNRDLQNTAMQYNAQNALPYAQMGQTQYNADADRAMRLKLAQMANSNGLLTGLLSV